MFKFSYAEFTFKKSAFRGSDFHKHATFKADSFLRDCQELTYTSSLTVNSGVPNIKA